MISQKKYNREENLKKYIIFLILVIILPLRIYSDSRKDSLFYHFESLKGKAKLKRILNIEEYYAEYNDSEVFKYYDEAIKLSEELSDNDAYFKAKEILSGYYFYHSEFDKVIELLTEVTNYQQLKNKPNVDDYTMLAFAFFKTKQYEKVLEYYEKAKESLPDKDQIGKGMLENLMGLTYYKLDYLDEAKDRFRSAIEIYKNTDDLGSLAVSYNNLALVYSLEDKFDEAIAYTKKSTALDVKNGNKYGIAISKLNIGSYYIAEKKYDLAKQYLSESEKLLIELDEKLKLANLYRNFGQLYFDTGKYLLARKYLEDSIKILENRDYDDVKILSLRVLAKVENHLHHYQKADSIFTEAINLEQKDAKRNLKNNIFKTKAKISFIDKNRKIKQTKEIIKFNNLKVKRRKDLIYFIALSVILGIVFYLLSRNRLRIIGNLYSKLMNKNKQLEATVELNNKILEEKIALEKNNTFLAMGITLNHEITQPLMVIQGNIDMMKMNPKLEEHQDVATALNNIEKSILKMKDMLEQMKEMEEI